MIEKINQLADTRHAAGVQGAESWALKKTNASPLTRQLFEAPRNASTYKGRFQQVMACSDAVGRLSGNALSSVSSVIAEKVITLPGEITIGLLEMIAKHFIGNSAGLTRFFNTCKKANTEFFGVFAAPVTIATQIALRTSALALGVVAASLTVGAVAIKDLSAWSWNKIKTGCTILAQQAARAWDAVKSKLIEIGKALGNAFVKTAKFLGAVIALALLAGVATITDAIKFTIGLLSFLYRTIQWNFGGGKKELSDLRLLKRGAADYSATFMEMARVITTDRTSSGEDKFIASNVGSIAGLARLDLNNNYDRKIRILINKKAPLATLPQRIRETSSVYAVFKNFQNHQKFQDKLKNSFQDCFRWETNGWWYQGHTSSGPSSPLSRKHTGLLGGTAYSEDRYDSSSTSSVSRIPQSCRLMSEYDVEHERETSSLQRRKDVAKAFEASASRSAPIRRSAASYASTGE